MAYFLTRKLFVKSLIGFVFGAVLLAFLMDGFSAWPFVSYNMYARMDLKQPRSYLFEAFTEDGSGGISIPFEAFRPYYLQDFSFFLNGSFPHEDPKILAVAAKILGNRMGELGITDKKGMLRLSRVQWNQGLDKNPLITVLGRNNW